MTLKYWMMVERYPNLKEQVGGLIPGCEISSLLDRNLVLALSTFCLQKEKRKRKLNIAPRELVLQISNRGDFWA